MRRVTSCKATYVRCMYVLVVTCHLHFWQNDRDLLRATAVTRGWNGYRNKSRHGELGGERKRRSKSKRDRDEEEKEEEENDMGAGIAQWLERRTRD